MGKEAIPYFDLKGSIPVKAKFEDRNKKQKLIVQAKTDNKIILHLSPLTNLLENIHYSS